MGARKQIHPALLLYLDYFVLWGCFVNEQVFNDAIEALRVSYRKMNPFCVPFATTNMGSAMLAMDLVSVIIIIVVVVVVVTIIV